MSEEIVVVIGPSKVEEIVVTIDSGSGDIEIIRDAPIRLGNPLVYLPDEQIAQALAVYLLTHPVEASPEQVAWAVDTWMQSNPVVVEEGQIAAAVSAWLVDNPPPAGEDATPEQIAEAVEAWLTENPIPPGENATPEQIATAVAEWLTDNPPAPGEDATPEMVETAVADYFATATFSKTDVGLDQVDNTSDANKPISTFTQAELDTKASITALNLKADDSAMAGKADLTGPGGTVPANQLPAYVDDVLEFSNFGALPAVGESGKIYVILLDGLQYRWSGSAYAEISASLALGETSSTAYRGDRGKTAYDHSLITSGNPHEVTATEVGLGSVDNTADLDKPISVITQDALDAKQAGHANLTTFAGINANIAGILASDGVGWIRKTFGQVKTSLGLTKSDVGLSNVDNTSDADKPISTATQTALGDKANLVGGVIPTSEIPTIAITEVFTAANQAAMLALTAERGDMALRTDDGHRYVLRSNSPSTLADWVDLGAATDTIASVNGQTGIVVLGKNDVGLGNVDNTTDLLKPISTATQTALNNCQPLDSDLTTIAALNAMNPGMIASDGTGWLRKSFGQLKTSLALVKADVGLSNVDNTSDANKPVSTAQATAIAAVGGGIEFDYTTPFDNVSRYGSISDGSATSSNADGLFIQRGTTAVSRMVRYEGVVPAQNLFDLDATYYFQGCFGSFSAANTWDGWYLFGSLGSPGLTHTLTAKHIGFHIKNNNGTPELYATNANGTTQTETLLTGVTLTNRNGLLITKTATQIKFYVNGTLKATHSTNIPAGAMANCHWQVRMAGVAGTTNEYMGINAIDFKYKMPA